MKRIFSVLLAFVLLTADSLYNIGCVNAAACDAGRMAYSSEDKTVVAGCNIFSIEINGHNAVVSYQATADAILVVTLYDNGRRKLFV